ncbi:hypothetical protein DFH06DRAFT_328535 [Mycena polygramma]|nr:hypothetical protein DFH06DRAFT_328535 [Mycena polygramma]
MSAATNPTMTNLVPTIESTVIPSTPASEWAKSTTGELDAQKPSTPGDVGPPVPGFFPDEPTPRSIGGGGGGDGDGDGKEDAAGGGGAGAGGLVETAKGYLPAQDDLQRALTNAGQAAKEWMPSSVAAYFPSSESVEEPDLAPPRPPFASDNREQSVSGLSDLSTQAQAGSLDSASTSTLPLPHSSATTDSTDNISTTVHTGGADSPHPVAPLGAGAQSESRFVEALPVSDSPAGSATPSFSDVSQSEGLPAPHNTLASDFSADDVDTPPATTTGMPPFVTPTAEALRETEFAAFAPSASPIPALSPAAPSNANVKESKESGEIKESKTDFATLGSASLNSSRAEDNFPADTPQSFIDEHYASLYPAASATPPSASSATPSASSTGPSQGSGDFTIQSQSASNANQNQGFSGFSGEGFISSALANSLGDGAEVDSNQYQSLERSKTVVRSMMDRDWKIIRRFRTVGSCRGF